MNANTSHALKLASLGFPVFAKKPNSKHEFEKGDALDWTHATTQPQAIKATFEANARLNIGYVIPKGVAIVDADMRRHDFERLPHIADEDALTTLTTTLGKHYAFKLPPELEDFTGEAKYQGVEVKGAGCHMTGAGSRIAGKEYKLLSSEIKPAPLWLCDFIAGELLKRQRKAERIASATLATPPANISPKRGRAWAEAVMLAECATIREAAQHERWHTIRACAYNVGTVAHFLSLDECRQQLEASASSFERQPAVRKHIANALEAGTRTPRYPSERPDRADWTLTRKAIAEMTHLCDVSAWRGSMAFNSPKNGRLTIRASTVRSILAALLQRAHTANTLEISMSQRLLAELASCGGSGAWKGIKALIEARMLEVKQASKSLDEGTVYRLIAKGFLALQRAELILKLESHTRYLERDGLTGSTGAHALDDGTAGEPFLPFLSSERIVDSNLRNVEDAFTLGIFGHSTMGKPAYIIARRLAQASLTAKELALSTGVPLSTVYRVLDKLAEAELIARGARGEASRLSDNFAEAAMRIAERKGTPEIAARRRERHEAQRKARREYLAALEAAKAEGKTIEARPIDDTRTPSEKANTRYAGVLEATRLKLEASAYWRKQTEAIYATH